MDSVFNTVLEMSMASSIVILIVILIRYFLRNRLSKAFSYALWGIVLIRLMIPIGFESSISIFNFITMPILSETNESTSKFTVDFYDNQSVSESESSRNFTNLNEINKNDMVSEGVSTDNDINNRGDQAQNNNISFAAIWLLISLFMLIYYTITYLKVLKLLDDAVIYPVKCSNRKVYISDKIDSPVLAGLIRPRIILPKRINLSDSELHYIIDHELIHIKRKDYVIKPFALIVLCVHWFNPLVWVSYLLAMKDMELSCDEAVLANSESSIKNYYANALLNISIKQNNLFNGGMIAFGEKNIKTRVKAALNFKKVPIYVKVIGAIAIILLAVVLISNGDQTMKMIHVLEGQYGYDIKEEDIIEIIEREDETLVFHKGFNKDGECPVYILSYVEAKGFDWIYSGAYYDRRVIDEMEEYYSTMAVLDAGDDNYRIVTGVVKGTEIDNIIVSSDFAALTDIEATTIKISESVTLWYQFVDKNLPASYTVEFINKEGAVLYRRDDTNMHYPLEAIQKIRGYEIPESNVIDISETDLGTLVFYYREIGGGSTVYCFELLEKTFGGYTWITGGQHSDGRLDDAAVNVSSVQYIEHLTENIQDGFIYGIMRSGANSIGITKSAVYSTWPYKPEVVPFSEDLTLWYSLLPEDFGGNYEIIFEGKDNNIFFIEGNLDYSEQKSEPDTTDLNIRRIYSESAEVLLESYMQALSNSDYDKIIALTFQ